MMSGKSNRVLSGIEGDMSVMFVNLFGSGR